MTHSRSQNIKLGAAIAAIVVGSVILVPFLVTRIAHANPLQFASSAQTAAATTTVSYMTPGTATTSIVYDTQQVNGTNQSNQGNTYVTDSMSLLTQLTASSTNTRLCRRVLYSQDLIDWYFVPQITSSSATTSIESSTYGEKCFNFASSTEPTIGTQTLTRRWDTIATPLRYIRIDYYLATSSPNNISANGAVWGQLLPIKQSK